MQHAYASTMSLHTIHCSKHLSSSTQNLQLAQRDHNVSQLSQKVYYNEITCHVKLLRFFHTLRERSSKVNCALSDLLVLPL